MMMNIQRVEVQETTEWGFQNAEVFIMLKCEWMKVSVCTLILAILREAHTTPTTTTTTTQLERGIKFETLFSLMLEWALQVCM